MTGPEAIAAAERLDEEIRFAFEDEGYGPSQGEVERMLTESRTTLSTLRLALLQSQEALTLAAIPLEVLRMTECDLAATALTRELKETIGLAVDKVRAALLSPPVAPKER